MFLKRLFDIVASFCGIVILFPLIVIVSILIKLTSKGPVLFKQVRVTKNGRLFKIYKFRTMRENSEGNKQITVGNDSRITGVGHILRKTKLDELPQLFNVLKGEMSLVGPRPEVPKYVELYTEEQREILKVSAGITDYASIYFSNESELLGEAENPEEFYIKKIMPYKIELNKKYIKEIGIVTDIKLIILTILKILGLVKLEPKEL
ncbi:MULTISPECIES: sugar transferase [Fusobacterium]|jgi:lipopolysaccharide/colanic/teichoic acid biosynthesis glycosyltransferase|uniref:Sugar transferase n=1 Tax=Fusobacterium mortiferum ATCC 9817 TaxID=469616 RepID=A0ABM6TU50_FUSMR|nr:MULTISPECIES: sugar transferase [Fusobacterium]AVQ18138.1 sugar transferase [Fusobacterium mortiferum ATCC 9817]EEO36668.1 bacterial sugar transferase [Fusobacterium mortiferum ATCC 9817]MDY2799935.1 sugar transferase [Fusobacterium mortiferum]MSS61279.1 sugar transferase [Fusobacterium sp. FSA-380-WT-2B]